jgi:hypothetical protein
MFKHMTAHNAGVVTPTLRPSDATMPLKPWIDKERVNLTVENLSHTSNIWHQRLGHLGSENLKKLVQNSMVDGISLNLDDLKELGTCAGCAA